MQHAEGDILLMWAALAIVLGYSVVTYNSNCLTRRMWGCHPSNGSRQAASITFKKAQARVMQSSCRWVNVVLCHSIHKTEAAWSAQRKKQRKTHGMVQPA